MYQEMFTIFKYLYSLTTQSGQYMNVTDNCSALLSLNLIHMILRASLVSSMCSDIESFYGTKFIPPKTIRCYNHESAQMSTIELVQSVDNGGNLQQSNTNIFGDNFADVC
uniref:Uncharacterized protein n=1 Tax=Glossina pallidipes TaxID=7398 RepID=A0A1A9ZJZ1_GLOPL